MNFIKKYFFKKALEKNKRKSDIEESLDIYIKEAMKEHASASRIAKKILSAKILKQQTRDTLSEIRELDEEEDNEDYEDEPNTQDKIINSLLEKFLIPKKNTNISSEFGGELPPNPKDNLKGLPLKELAPTLTKQQLKILKEKGIL